MTTFAATGNWDELEKLSRLKKSPIGYEPFVDVCIEQDNTVEAARYLPRVEESLQVPDRWFDFIGPYKKAISWFPL